MNINMRKQEILNGLYHLENDCRILLKRIPVYRDDVLRIKTEGEAEEFNKTHNIEEGLKIIELF